MMKKLSCCYSGVCGDCRMCEYRSFSGEMAVLAIVNALQAVVTCFTTYEMAQSRFRCFWYALTIPIAKSTGLYLLTGYTFFEGIFPETLIRVIRDFDPCRLSFLLGCFLVTNIVIVVCFAVDMFLARTHEDSVETAD